jgi:hydroxyacylglutathione hydrolase
MKIANMIKIEAIPTFQDNYVWAIHNDHTAILVDPGEARPILTWLANRNITASAILVTHHHHDHVGGIGELLKQASIPVYGPARGAAKSIPVSDGDFLTFDNLGLSFQVIETPGHTLDHVCYLASEFAEFAEFANKAPETGSHRDSHLFCGDTLFSCGCGRLFEGTPAEMHNSLSRLAALPEQTLVYCAHEYTLATISFALEVEAENPDLIERHKEALALRKQGKPTLPVSVGRERKTNPFLRCDQPSAIEAASQHFNKPLSPGVETFAAIRAWKDEE